MFADTVQEEHLCLDCGGDISHRRRDAQRCEVCSYIRTKERTKNYYRKNRTRVLQRIKSRQQTSEYKELRHEWEKRNPEKFLVYRQRKKQKHREETGYNPDGRTCEKCDADISDRGHGAKKCVPCSTPPARKCIVCGNDIGKRGPRKFCSEQCKVQDQQSRESKGYTKTCTKCNETKEHTDFGLHYSLRRSVCKTCEVKAAQEHYQSLPVDERRRRRRIQGKRERDKRASLSPEGKTMLRTKIRRAHRRKLYGPDFDEDRLYSEQEGRCAICRTLKSLEELEVDHDHEARTLPLPVRGFLCKNCNFKLLSRYEKGFPRYRQDSPYLNAYLSRGKQQ